MTTKTLRTLIDDVIKNDPLSAVMSLETIELHKKIMKIIDLYDEDNSQPIPKPFTPTPGFRVETIFEEPAEVPYGVVCPCNPNNGGSGICGCTMGNIMVPNPKKYNAPISKWGTTTNVTAGYPPGTTITNTPGTSSINIKTTNT